MRYLANKLPFLNIFFFNSSLQNFWSTLRSCYASIFHGEQSVKGMVKHGLSLPSELPCGEGLCLGLSSTKSPSRRRTLCFQTTPYLHWWAKPECPGFVVLSPRGSRQSQPVDPQSFILDSSGGIPVATGYQWSGNPNFGLSHLRLRCPIPSGVSTLP